MAESNSEPQPRCPCGFWGSSKTSGLCSKCFREHEKKSKSMQSSEKSSNAINSDIVSQALKHIQPVTSDSTSNDEKNREEANISSISQKSTDEPSTSKNNNDERPAEELLLSQNGSSTSLNGSSTALNGSTSNSRSSTPTSIVSTLQSSQVSTSNGTKRELENEANPDRPPQKNRKRCFKCNCKLELAIREIGLCKCGYVFCQLHRLPELHNCDFDHKGQGRQEDLKKMVSPKKHIGTTLKRIDSDS